MGISPSSDHAYRCFRDLYRRSAEAGANADFLADFPATFRVSMAKAKRGRGTFISDVQIKFLIYANLGALFWGALAALTVLMYTTDTSFDVGALLATSLPLVIFFATLISASFLFAAFSQDQEIRRRLVDILAQEFSVHHSSQFETPMPPQSRTPHTFAPPHVTSHVQLPADQRSPSDQTSHGQRWYPL